MSTEFEDEFGEWLVHTVQVQRFLGPGPKGPVLQEAAPVAMCMLNWKNRLVRGSNTEERVSDTMLVTVLENAAAFEPESLVTLPDGKKRTVLSRAVDDVALPLAHVRVVLV